MIPVLILLMAVATLLTSLPYWMGRSSVRYRVWQERDRLFDELTTRGWDDDVLWGLVDRCEILTRLSTLLTPMTLALTRGHPEVEPPPSRAFPNPEDIALLTDTKRAFYDDAVRRGEVLLVRQMLLTTWHGLCLGIVIYISVFARPGPARDALAMEARRRIHGEPERAMAAGAFC